MMKARIGIESYIHKGIKIATIINPTLSKISQKLRST